MNLFDTESKSKKMGVGCVCVGRGGGGVDVWTDKQAQTISPFQLLRSWGHNNAFMYKLCP